MRTMRLGGLAVALLLVGGCAAAALGSASPRQSSPRVTASAGASLSTTAAATPIVVPGAVRLPSGGQLEPGRYFVPAGPWSPVTYSFAVPPGWVAENGGQSIGKHPNESGRQVGFSVSIVDRLFSDPCGPDTTVDVGPTATDLMTALLALPGPTFGSPVDVTLEGRSGKRVEVTVSAEVDVEACDPPIGLQIWLDRNGNKYLVVGPESVGQILAVDTDAGRFVAVYGADHTAAPADVAELQAVIASIEFES